MAFVFTDLFSCGRARRTRDLTAEAHDADVNTATPEDLARQELSTFDIPLINAPHIVRPTSPDGPERLPENVQGEPARRPEEQDDVFEKKDNVEMAVVREKAKPSNGWMMERRVLVTTKSSGTSGATPVSEASEDIPPVASATPEPAPLETFPPSPPMTLERESMEAGSFIPTAPKMESHDAVLPVCATSELDPEKLDASVSVAMPELQKADTPISLAMPEPESHEVAPIVLEMAAEEQEVQLPVKAAPVGLLDLPAELRNLIYEQMTEDEPIRMCRHDDPALTIREGETAPIPKRQFYSLTQVCRKIREEFLPIYMEKTEYVIDLWTQKAHLAKVIALKGHVSMDIDAACFDMEPIDLLPLIRGLARTGRKDCCFSSAEGVVFRSISSIVAELNKLLPSADVSNASWLETVNDPIRRIELHLFPHDDIRQYYRFRGAEPLLRIVYPSNIAEGWMKQSFKSQGYEAYLNRTGLDGFEMHVVVGHASRRTTNEGRLPLDWRLSYRMSVDIASRLSLDRLSRLSIDRAPRMSSSLAR